MAKSERPRSTKRLAAAGGSGHVEIRKVFAKDLEIGDVIVPGSNVVPSGGITYYDPYPGQPEAALAFQAVVAVERNDEEYGESGGIIAAYAVTIAYYIGESKVADTDTVFQARAFEAVDIVIGDLSKVTP